MEVNTQIEPLVGFPRIVRVFSQLPSGCPERCLQGNSTYNIFGAHFGDLLKNSLCSSTTRLKLEAFRIMVFTGFLDFYKVKVDHNSL